MPLFDIHVRPRHIARGAKMNCKLCPVALALRQQVPHAVEVTVNGTPGEILIVRSYHKGTEQTEHTVPVPAAVLKFIRRFDRDKQVKQFTFQITLPSLPRVYTKPGIDLGLAVIEALREPGECLTRADIAAVCGCSPQRIQEIERRAFMKLRRRADLLRRAEERRAA